jgi:hypothetical protein
MTRTAEIRDRLTDDNRIDSWITELLSRLPLDDSQPDTPAFRFAETVKVNRARMRYAASEPWFDRTTPTDRLEPEAKPISAIAIVYPPAEPLAERRRLGRRVVNQLMARWWKITGQGSARVAWSIE